MLAADPGSLGPGSLPDGADDMFNCSNCGHQIDDSRVALPPFCPRCGTPTGSGSSPFDDDDDDLPPLPPPPPMPMAGGSNVAPLPPPPAMGAPLPPPPPASGRGEPSKTLFGMAGLDFDADLPFPSDDDDEVPPVRQSPPPARAPGPPKPPPVGRAKPPALGGPPPVGGAKPPALGGPPPLGGPSPVVREPDLPAASPSAGSFREFDFSDDGDSLELGDLDAGLGGPPADLPAPASRYDSDFDDLGFAGDAGDLDLPAPARAEQDLDLPAPAGPASLPDLDLPAPVSHADLPAPAGGGFDPGFDDGALSLDDLPMPAGDDFPAPVDDFPAPRLDDLDDLDDFDSLPTSADSLSGASSNLPAPADVLPTPASDLPRSADILPTPVEDLGLDLDLDGDHEAFREPDPEPAGAGAAAGAAAPKRPTGPVAAVAKPGRRNVGRIVIYGILGLAVLGAGAGYVAMEMGLFDPEPPPPMAKQDGGEEPPPPPPPSGEVGERSPEVLAKLDLDTPAAYAQVQAEAAKANDQLAEAEALLLQHYRYGPNPEAANRASQLLANFPDQSPVYVGRVVGLGLLGAGQLDAAVAAFAADEPRSQLYRAWALLEQGKHGEARAAAEAAIASRPNDQAAQLAVLEARYAANPVDGLAAMRQAAGSSPEHLALHEALFDAALEQGLLAEAKAIGDKLDLGAVSPGHKAELLRRRAALASAQGNIGEAMRLLEQAVATQEGFVAARVARIELWLELKDFPALRADMDLLAREHGQDPAVVKLAARVDLLSGRDDDAREGLAKLGEAAASDPEVHEILGLVHGLTNKTGEAQAAFAEARKLDPFYVPVILAEAELLAREQPERVLIFLDAQQAALEGADAEDSPRGRAALAAIARERARIYQRQGQPERALTAAEDASKLDPGDNQARLLRAKLLAELGQRKAYEDALMDLFERTGGYPGLTEPLGDVLLRRGKLDELDGLIGAGLDDEEASREMLLTGAALRLAQDKPAQAKLLAQKVLDRDPTDSRGHLLVGRALLAEGDYTRALDEIESARTLEGDPEVELWLGQALEYNGRASEARSHYQKALELDPRNLEAAALLGRLYAYEGGARKALDLLEPVVEQTDAYPYAWLAIGLAQRDLAKREAAVAAFQKAQELDASLFEAYYQEGRIHNDKNQHSAAVKALQAGIDKAIANAQDRQLLDAYRRLGESYYELGRKSEAKTALSEYLKLADANAAGRPEVERMLRGL